MSTPGPELATATTKIHIGWRVWAPANHSTIRPRVSPSASCKSRQATPQPSSLSADVPARQKRPKPAATGWTMTATASSMLWIRIVGACWPLLPQTPRHRHHLQVTFSGRHTGTLSVQLQQYISPEIKRLCEGLAYQLPSYFCSSGGTTVGDDSAIEFRLTE